MSEGSLPSGDYETDREQISAIIANRAPELSTSPTAFGGEQAGAFAQFSQSIGGDISRAGNDAVPSVNSSDDGLNSWAVAEGISNGTGPGGYGRRGATFASGAISQLSGDAGTVYPVGQQATAGGVTLVLASSVTLPGFTGTSQAPATWNADPSNPANAGQAGNLSAGTVLSLISPPGSADSATTLDTGMAILGQDQESSSSLLTRILNKMQRPPNGGNGTDFRDWAEDARDGNGNPVTTSVLVAFVYPNYYGAGSPLVVVLQVSHGTSRIVTAGPLAAIKTYINGSTSFEGQRPVGLGCEVLSGYMPPSRALVCRVRCVVANDKLKFDWARLTTSYTVFSVTTSALPSWATTAGANVVLELQMLAPISLKDAIAASAQPHIQVDTKNGPTLLGPVVPQQWPVVASIDAAGRTSLGLKVPAVSDFSTWVFTGNAVYSGGPIVLPVSENLRATIDSIGPSRASGLADPAQIWQDVVGVTTLSTAAETTVAADGVTKLVVRCIAGGVLIGIGGGVTPTAQDVPASDNTINGPEVLYPGRILVTD